MKLRVAKKIVTNSYWRVRKGTWNKAERVWDRWVIRGERKTIWYNKSELQELQELVFGDDQVDCLTSVWLPNEDGELVKYGTTGREKSYLQFEPKHWPIEASDNPEKQPNLQTITTEWPTNTCVSIQLDFKSVEDYVKRQQEIEQEIIKSLNIATKLHNPLD